jgi:putative molybdopterin biosynthesis protein
MSRILVTCQFLLSTLGRSEATPQHRPRMTNAVRAWRERLGLSQHELASRARTSRQTVVAIEAGRTVPSTVLALRLATVLGGRVEELFRLPGSGDAGTWPARLIGRVSEDPASRRVRLVTVGNRTVAVPLAGSLLTVPTLAEADGIVCGGRGASVRVRLLSPPGRLAETVVVAGCDPALPVVAAHLHRFHPRYRLTWLSSGSLQALRWLRDGAAHIAGLHLRDPRTGQENVPLVRRVLDNRRVMVLGFARWEEGLMVAPGNPRGIHGVADLARTGIAIINREEGSGARALLDAALVAAGLSTSQVHGYARVAYSHLAVAQAVALGLVDAGCGVRAAARAFSLEFVPLQRERYDLVIPEDLVEHPPVQAFFDSARTAAVRSELEAVGEYDTSQLGATVAVIP